MFFFFVAVSNEHHHNIDNSHFPRQLLESFENWKVACEFSAQEGRQILKNVREKINVTTRQPISKST